MSEILKAIRKAIRDSQHSRYVISKALDIDQAQLSRLMKGEGGMSLDRLEKLAAFLDLEIIIRAKRKKG